MADSPTLRDLTLQASETVSYLFYADVEEHKPCLRTTFWKGASLAAHDQAIQWIGQQVQTQASFLAYMDAFWVLMLISLAAVPLALTLRKVKLGGAVSMGH